MTNAPALVDVTLGEGHILMFSFNPFCVPPRTEPTSYVNLLVDVFAEAYSFGGAMERVLRRGLLEFHKFIGGFHANPNPTG